VKPSDRTSGARRRAVARDTGYDPTPRGRRREVPSRV